MPSARLPVRRLLWGYLCIQRAKFKLRLLVCLWLFPEAFSIHPNPTHTHAHSSMLKMAASVAHFRHRKLYMLLAKRRAKFAPWQLDRRKRQAKIIEWALWDGTMGTCVCTCLKRSKVLVLDLPWRFCQATDASDFPLPAIKLISGVNKK